MPSSGAPPFPRPRRRPGGGLPAVRLRPREPAGPRRVRPQRRRRRPDRGGGRGPRARRVRCGAAAPTRRGSPASTACPSRRVGLTGGSGFAIAASRTAGRAALVPPDVATCERLPARALRPARPPLPLPVRQLHELRPAVHDCPDRAVRPREHDDGWLPDVRGLPRRVRAIRPTAASTPRRRAAPPAGRGSRCRSQRRWRCCATERCSRSRGSAATTSPASPATRHAVARLRSRKQRDEKPFAVMTAEPESIADLLRRGARAAPLARGADRARCGGFPEPTIAPSVAPAGPWLGVMLPYSPLHHLLCAELGAAARPHQR